MAHSNLPQHNGKLKKSKIIFIYFNNALKFNIVIADYSFNNNAATIGLDVGLNNDKPISFAPWQEMLNEFKDNELFDYTLNIEYCKLEEQINDRMIGDSEFTVSFEVNYWCF